MKAKTTCATRLEYSSRLTHLLIRLFMMELEKWTVHQSILWYCLTKTEKQSADLHLIPALINWSASPIGENQPLVRETFWRNLTISRQLMGYLFHSRPSENWMEKNVTIPKRQ